MLKPEDVEALKNNMFLLRDYSFIVKFTGQYILNMLICVLVMDKSGACFLIIPFIIINCDTQLLKIHFDSFIFHGFALCSRLSADHVLCVINSVLYCFRFTILLVWSDVDKTDADEA